MKELRSAILRMHSFGDLERTIAEALRIPKTTVHRTIQRGTVEDREGRGRKKTSRTTENIEQASLNSSCYFVLFVSCFEKNSHISKWSVYFVTPCIGHSCQGRNFLKKVVKEPVPRQIKVGKKWDNSPNHFKSCSYCSE